MAWERGHRVVVRELGETPLEALDRHVALEPMDAPDVGGCVVHP